MKTIIISLLALALAIPYAAHSQLKHGQKGPEAKNYKPWKDKKVTTKEYQTVVIKRKKGPEGKNAKVWERDHTQTLAINTTRRLRPIKGPEAKNRKPWEDQFIELEPNEYHSESKELAQTE